MTDWRAVLLLGAGVMKATDIAKEVFDRATGLTPRPYLKSLVATGLSVGAALAYADGWRERVLVASGVAGTAAALHEGYSVLSTAADRNKAVVIGQAARQAVSAQMPSGGPGSRIRSL